MWSEAQKRICDAETLERATGGSSDSHVLLRLLGLELLLKITYELSLRKSAPSNHEYKDIFGGLPIETQSAILELAGTRIGPSKLASSLPEILSTLGKNFIALRYPWVRYKGMTEVDFANAGNDWLAKGAPDDEAAFLFYPNELRGLIFGLTEHLKSNFND